MSKKEEEREEDEAMRLVQLAAGCKRPLAASQPEHSQQGRKEPHRGLPAATVHL
jgi:hypothetical protein